MTKYLRGLARRRHEVEQPSRIQSQHDFAPPAKAKNLGLELFPMIIDECTIPDAVVDVYCALIDTLESAKLVKECGENSIFLKGHRAISQNAHVARERIKAALRSDRLLNPSIRSILQCTGLYRDVVIVLSEAALEEAFSDLAIYFGEPAFLAGAFLDPREKVHQLAQRFTSRWNEKPSDPEMREKAGANIRKAFVQFLGTLKALMEASAPPSLSSPSSGDQKEQRKLEKSLEQAQAALVRETHTSAKEQKALHAKLAQSEQATNRLERELEIALKEFKTLKTSLDDTQKSLSEAQANFQQQVDQSVSTALSNNLRQWLEPVREVNAALAEANNSDLLNRANTLLTRQRSVDRSSGNRAELHGVLKQYRQALSELTDAGINSLNPLPDISAMTSALTSKIADIERRLGISGNQLTPIETQLLVRITAAQSHDGLSQIRKFIQDSTDYTILDRGQLQRIYRAVDLKAGLLYDKAQLLRKDASQAEEKLPFNLRRAAATGQAFTLFIDGHNVLFALADASGRGPNRLAPDAKARTHFANSLLTVFRKPGANVMLYFDGDDPTEQALSDQVRVIYSGGKGEHRADNAILQHMQYFLPSIATTPITLVTKDIDFAHQAALMGVGIIYPEEFALLLESSSK
jgi:hypothetical protein